MTSVVDRSEALDGRLPALTGTVISIKGHRCGVKRCAGGPDLGTGVGTWLG